jgi:hypothetical protein
MKGLLTLAMALRSMTTGPASASENREMVLHALGLIATSATK